MTTTLTNPKTTNDTCYIAWSFASQIVVNSLTYAFHHVNANLAGVSVSGSVSTQGNLTATPGFNTGFSYNATATYTRSGSANQTVSDTGSDTTYPQPPYGLACFASTGNSGGQISVSWSASAAQTYNVYRDGGLWLANTSSTSATDTGLTAGSSHSYYIYAIDSGVKGAIQTGPSSTASATAAYYPPPAPTGASCSASTNGAGSIYVSWSASGATGYSLYVDGSFYQGSSATNITFTGLVEGSSHSYYVIPYAIANGLQTNGSASNTATATAGYSPPAAPATPTGLYGYNTTGSNRVVVWSGSASGFLVYRNGSQIGSSGSNSYTDTSPVVPGTYTVYAYNSGPGGTTYSGISANLDVEPDSGGVLIC